MTTVRGVGRWPRAVVALVATVGLTGCSVQDVLADRARQEAREIAEAHAEQPDPPPPEESDRPDAPEVPETPDDAPESPDEGSDAPDDEVVSTLDDADVRAGSLVPGRFTLGGEGYSLTLEVVYAAPTEVAGADRAHIVVTDDGTNAVGNVVARSDTGSVLAVYAASSGSFDPAVVGYVADELLVGLASLEETDEGTIGLAYPTADGDAIQVGFELFGEWYLETEQDVVLRRFVTDRGEELEYRLVVNDRVDLDGLVDELSASFPAARFDTADVDVPGADEALLVDIDAADTDDRFVQRSILVGHDVGFTFQLTYVARPDVFDPDTADRHLETFALKITDDLL